MPNDGLTFLRPGGTKVQFMEKSLQTITSYIQDRPNQPEAGGILLGRLIEESNDVVVDEATVPTKSDRRRLFSFHRSRKVTQERVNAAWRDSEQTLNYLGEWHTHPEEDPQPSTKDLKNWKIISGKAKYEQDFLLFVIVGIRVIRVWQIQKGGNDIVELVRCS